MISYAICVCNEHQELKNLLEFLQETKNENDEIVILVDSKKENKLVSSVIGLFHNNVKVFTRSFDGDFAAHKNYLNSCCSGDIIFNIDADEIPQEGLMKVVNDFSNNEDFDVLYVPRINICPGYTQEFINKHKFNVNEMGLINWPDYQGRIYKKGVQWEGKVHEKPNGKNIKLLPASTQLALWHVKSVSKQNKQNDLYNNIQE